MADNNIPTGTTFIKNLMARANTVSDEIGILDVKQKQLESEIKMYRKQLADVNGILNYTNQVEGIVEGLEGEIKAVQDFFVVPDGETPDPAQLDLAPANTTLKNVIRSSVGVAGRLFQSIVNINTCVTALDATQTKLLAAVGAPGSTASDDSDSTPYGHLSMNMGPSSGLISKLQQAIKAGLTAMESLANTYLGLIYFLQQVEQAYHESLDLNESFNSQLKQLNKFESRNQNRIRVETTFQKELNDEIITNQSELDTTVSKLKALELDYAMVKAEFEAANQSIRPAKKVAATA